MMAYDRIEVRVSHVPEVDVDVHAGVQKHFQYRSGSTFHSRFREVIVDGYPATSRRQEMLENVNLAVLSCCVRH